MQIIGIVEKVMVQTSPPKRIAIIIDVFDECSYAIEFRKNLMHKAGMLIPGDVVNVSFKMDARVNARQNAYNNAVAEKLERL